MATSETEVLYAVKTAEEAARRFREYIDQRRVALSDFPSEAPRMLIRLLDDLAGEIARSVAERADRVRLEEVTEEEFPDIIGWIGQPLIALAHLHRAVAVLDCDSPIHVPYPLLHHLKRTARGLLERSDVSCEVLLLPQHTYNYTYWELRGWIRERLDWVTPSLTPLLEEVFKRNQFPDRFIVIGYPVSERQSVLQHAAMFHEIGHLACGIRQDSGDEGAVLLGRVLGKLASQWTQGIDKLADKLARDQWTQEHSQGVGAATVPTPTGEDGLEEYRAAYKQELLRLLRVWTSEVLSDVLCVTLLGPAGFLGIVQTLWRMAAGAAHQASGNHPAPAFRARAMLARLGEPHGTDGDDTNSGRSLMDGYPTPRPLDFTHWAARASAHHDAPELSDPQKMIEGCIESLVPAIVNEVDTLLASAGMAYDAASFGRKAGQITDEMVQGIPPICQCLPKERKHAPYVLSEVYNAGWIVQLHRLEEMEKLFKKLEPSERERQARTLLDDHVLKALESLPITWTWYKKYSTETIPNAGFADRMYDDSAHDRLDILPLLRPSKQIQGNSIDLRLGSYFLFTRRSKQPLYDPRPVAGKPAPDARQFQEMVYVPFGKRFILHPGQFVLGCTFEYIRLPCTLSAHIVGRSSWGRVALVIATATAVSPGYSGVLVLELANLGEHPIALYPGARIAQLVLYEVPRCESYLEGRPSYIGPVRTEYTKLSQDADWEDVMPVDPGEDAG